MNALERPSSPLRSDTWAVGNPHGNANYRLRIEAEPDSLCRVLNLFAMQFLTPHSVQVDKHEDWLDVQIGVAGLSWHRAEVIARKLHNLVCVDTVSIESQPVLKSVPLHPSSAALP